MTDAQRPLRCLACIETAGAAEKDLLYSSGQVGEFLNGSVQRMRAGSLLRAACQLSFAALLSANAAYSLLQVGEDKLECAHGGVAEGIAPHGDTDVGIAGDELEALLEAPHAALHDLHDDRDHDVALLQPLRLTIDVRQHSTNRLHHRND